jgi:hypothetical protein
MTRALSLLMHGRIRSAWATNPRCLLVAPVLLWLAIWGESKAVGRQEDQQWDLFEPALVAEGLGNLHKF